MIPVALPTYNRPQYLKQVLSWLEANKYADRIKLFTSEEPNRECQELISECPLPKERIINSKRLGMAANVCQAITAAAKQTDWFVCVEDDVLISYDSIQYAEWALHNGFEIACFENASSSVHDFDYEIYKTDWVHCHGWACISKLWFEFLKDFNPKKNPFESWANPFNYWVMSMKFFDIAIPALSRSYYIGVEGEKSTKEKYKNHIPDEWARMNDPKKYTYEQFVTSKPSKDYIKKECKKYYEIGAL